MLRRTSVERTGYYGRRLGDIMREPIKYATFSKLEKRLEKLLTAVIQLQF